jgi:hypothetical protein
MLERSALTTREQRYSMLLKDLQAVTGGNPVLASLDLSKDRPSASEYKEMNWGDPDFIPYEDEEEMQVINILSELDEMDQGVR